MAEFKTIHTNYGLESLASAEAQGTTINLPTIAVGDGNGNPVTPTAEQTQLVRERYRAAVNRVYQDPNDAKLFYAELVIPATVGGFVMREIGVFDSTGSLFAVGNLPETYKPDESEGSFSDTALRIGFKVSNAETIQIISDPNIVVITQAWIENNVTAAMIIPGGTTGQTLTKKSNEDGDYVWSDPDVQNIIVDVIEERQTLAASQTVVTWGTVTTRGLAVYIEGVRVNKGPGVDEWTENATNPETKVKLGQAYPAGTSILGVQNNPSGNAPYPLVRNQNLADVPNKGTARTNLDVYSKAEAEAIVPPGAVMYFARNSAPPGWLKCNGAAISRTAYSKLFAAIGTVFGAGDGFTTFNLPDLRGEFVRGWDDGRGVDGGRAFGSFQAGAIQRHSHHGISGSAGSHNHSGSAVAGGSHNHSASTGGGGSHAHNGSTNAAGNHTHYLASNGTFGMRDNTLNRSPNHLSGQYENNLLYTPTAAMQSRAYLTTDGNHSHSFTTSTIRDHTHSVSVGTGGVHTHALSINSGGAHTHPITIHASGGSETRPRNIALLPCIRF